MKKLLLILLCLPLFFTTCKPQDDVSGIWINKGDNFENVLILEKLNPQRNVYNFTFDSWILLYDHLSDDTVKFTGGMHGDVFTIEIKDNTANYNDEIQVFEDGFNVYNEGEEKCNVYFTFNQNNLNVRTKSCVFIYGGYGVSFDGKYVRQ